MGKTLTAAQKSKYAAMTAQGKKQIAAQEKQQPKPQSNVPNILKVPQTTAPPQNKGAMVQSVVDAVNKSKGQNSTLKGWGASGTQTGYNVGSPAIGNTVAKNLPSYEKSQIKAGTERYIQKAPAMAGLVDTTYGGIPNLVTGVVNAARSGKASDILGNQLSTKGDLERKLGSNINVREEDRGKFIGGQIAGAMLDPGAEIALAGHAAGTALKAGGQAVAKSITEAIPYTPKAGKTGIATIDGLGKTVKTGLVHADGRIPAPIKTGLAQADGLKPSDSMLSKRESIARTLAKLRETIAGGKNTTALKNAGAEAYSSMTKSDDIVKARQAEKLAERKLAQEAAQQAGKVGKETAEQAAKETAQQVGEETAEKAAKEAVENAGKSKKKIDFKKVGKYGAIGTGLIGAGALVADYLGTDTPASQGATLDTSVDDALLTGIFGEAPTEEDLSRMEGVSFTSPETTQSYSGGTGTGGVAGGGTGTGGYTRPAAGGGGSAPSVGGGFFSKADGSLPKVYYYDENGEQTSGDAYIINGKAYLDPQGKVPVPAGSAVENPNYQAGNPEQPEFWWKEDLEKQGIGKSAEETMSLLEDWYTENFGMPETEEDLMNMTQMEQIMEPYKPQLDAIYAQIDQQTEQEILQLREELAARGIYNSDAAIGMENEIRESARQQKAQIYGQMATEAYNTWLEQKQAEEEMAREDAYRRQQMAFEQEKYNSTMSFNQQKLAQDQANKDRSYELDRYNAYKPRSGGSSKPAPSRDEIIAGIANSFAGDMISDNMSLQQAKQMAAMEAKGAGLNVGEAQQILTFLQNVANQAGGR